PERIVVTTGSSAGFILTFLAAFDAGDRVLLGAPGYPSYRNILASLGVEVVSHAVGPEDGWCLNAEHVSADVEAQREGSGLAGVMFASPANPTGSVMSPVVLRETIRASRAAGATVISDEIYHGLVYGEARAETALAHDDDVIVVNSFSKYHSMTGWRIGWLVVPDDMVRAIERLAQHLFISAPTLSQYAAVGALSDAARSELEGYRAGYAANRDRLLSALPKMGLSAWAPADGAFYLYVDTTPWGADSLSLAGCILEETDVAVTSGVDFDPERGRHYMRLSYARRGEDIEDGIARLQAFANRI
ncbi:MAG: aminotransferase class I/II-fold pyridoxal phosphate-dependent enzyme, partial [Pseudomonadota bacterium]